MISRIRFLSLAPVVIALLLGFTLRLLPVIEGDPYRKGFGAFGDSYLYHVIAYNLIRGQGFSGNPAPGVFGKDKWDGKPIEARPVIMRAPLYPAFIATVYTLFGSSKAMESRDTWPVNWDRLRVVQIILDSLVVVLLFLLVKQLLPSSRIVTCPH
jgi:hypothetical protein